MSALVAAGGVPLHVKLPILLERMFTLLPRTRDEERVERVVNLLMDLRARKHAGVGVFGRDTSKLFYMAEAAEKRLLSEGADAFSDASIGLA